MILTHIFFFVIIIQKLKINGKHNFVCVKKCSNFKICEFCVAPKKLKEEKKVQNGKV